MPKPEYLLSFSSFIPGSCAELMSLFEAWSKVQSWCDCREERRIYPFDFRAQVSSVSHIEHQTVLPCTLSSLIHPNNHQMLLNTRNSLSKNNLPFCCWQIWLIFTNNVCAAISISVGCLLWTAFFWSTSQSWVLYMWNSLVRMCLLVSNKLYPGTWSSPSSSSLFEASSKSYLMSSLLI